MPFYQSYCVPSGGLLYLLGGFTDGQPFFQLRKIVGSNAQIGCDVFRAHARDYFGGDLQQIQVAIFGLPIDPVESDFKTAQLVQCTIKDSSGEVR